MGCVQMAGLIPCKNKICDLQNSDVASSGDGSTMFGYNAMKRLYLEFDHQNNQVGFANRSDTACNSECSAYIAATTCELAKCTWSGSACSGTPESGNAEVGSLVVLGACARRPSVDDAIIV